MPEIARFFGIVIRMYAEPASPHHLPHLHAYYEACGVVYGIQPIKRMGGALPLRQLRLVEAWAELHQEQLLDNWNRLQSGRPPLPIAPLQ